MKFKQVGTREEKNNSKIDVNKRKRMGKLPNKFKIKGKISENPKTNEPFKKTKLDCENIIKKIIRKIIRVLPELLNNNVKNISQYTELKNLIKKKLNKTPNNSIKREIQIFKSLENNNKKNPITGVTVNNYLKIKDMTLYEIFNYLEVSRIHKNYFPFHNTVLIEIIKGRENEENILKILKFTFHDILLLYKYLPKYLNDNNIIKDLDSDLKGMQYYKQTVEKNYNEEIKEKISKLIEGINIENFETIYHSIKKFCLCKDGDEYDEKYIDLYIDSVFNYDEFFEKRGKNKKKNDIPKNSKSTEDSRMDVENEVNYLDSHGDAGVDLDKSYNLIFPKNEVSIDNNSNNFKFQSFYYHEENKSNCDCIDIESE